MAKKPIINPVSPGNNAAAINANLYRIQEAFDNTVSRDGSTPNHMLADFDMNSNDILNVGVIQTDQLLVRGVDFEDYIEEARNQADRAEDEADRARDEADRATEMAAAAYAEAERAEGYADEVKRAATQEQTTFLTVEGQTLYTHDSEGNEFNLAPSGCDLYGPGRDILVRGVDYDITPEGHILLAYEPDGYDLYVVNYLQRYTNNDVQQIVLGTKENADRAEAAAADAVNNAPFVVKNATEFFSKTDLVSGARYLSKDGCAWDVLSSGTGHLTVAGKQVNVVPVNGVWNFLSFGADHLGITPIDTAWAKAMEVISPYPYNPSFSNGSAGTFTQGGALMLPFGRYGHTDTLLINPNVRVFFDFATPANFGASNGSPSIVALNDINGFQIDNAPWAKGSGTREKNVVGLFTELDGSTRQIVANIHLENIRVISGGHDVLGGVNLVNALGSKVERCSIMGQGVPLRWSATFNHRYVDNLLRGRNMGFYASRVTTGVFDNNYIIFHGNPMEDFTYPMFPDDATVNSGTRGGHLLEANISGRNTVEGAWTTGVAMRFNTGTVFDGWYMEKITYACYATSNTSAYIKPGYTACPGATLWVGHAYNRPAQGVTLDWTELPAKAGPGGLVDRLLVSDIVKAGSGGSGNAITLKPSTDHIPGAVAAVVSRVETPPQIAPISGSDAAVGAAVIYVSSTGDDTNWGLSPNEPVKSLAAAISRAMICTGSAIRILLQNGETIYTGSSDTATAVINMIMTRDVEIVGNDFKASGSSTLPVLQQSGNGTNSALLSPSGDNKAITFRNVDVRQKESSTTGTNGLIRLQRATRIAFANCSIELESRLFAVTQRASAVLDLTNTNVALASGKSSAVLFGGAGSAVATVVVGGGTVASGITRGSGTFIHSDVAI